MPGLTGPATPHPKYVEFSDQWKTCTDVISGATAVKAAGERYLPKLVGDSDADYKAYQSRAVWFAASGRSVDALVGAIMRKPMEVKAPALVMDDLETGVTVDGATIVQFASRLLHELLSTGRAIVLIDWDEDNDQPVWRLYKSLSVVNWRETRTGIIEMITVMESTVTKAVDPETGKSRKWGTVVSLRPKRIEQTSDGVRVTTWREKTPEENKAFSALSDEDGGWISDTDVTWLRRGKAIKVIPVAAASAEGRGLTPVELPLEDLCLLNVNHYVTSAQLGQAIHYTASPVYYAIGVDKQDGEVRIQSRTLLTLGQAQLGGQVQLGILEYAGHGVEPIMKRLDQMERQMTALGARPLTQQSMASTAPEAIRLRSSGEQALLTRLVAAVESTLEHAVREHAAWRGVDAGNVKVELNRDFMPARLTPGEIQVLLAAVQAGQITTEAFLAAMVAGEVLTKAQAVPPPEPPPLPQKETDNGSDPDGRGTPSAA